MTTATVVVLWRAARSSFVDGKFVVCRVFIGKEVVRCDDEKRGQSCRVE